MKQQGFLYESIDSFAEYNYPKCISMISKAENLGHRSESMSAEILFFKGLCLEKMGKPASNEAFETLIDLYPNTDWALAAQHKLKYEKLKCQ